jgi:hypothetical protein
MTSSAPLVAQLSAAIDALTAVSREVADYRNVDDELLLELAKLASVERQLADTHNAVIAGEVARRSAPALGHSGLAQRSGHRTPEELVRVTTNSSARDAASAVRMGRLLGESLEPDPDGESRTWLEPVTAAMAAGSLAPAAADAICSGLGAPTGTVSADSLASAARQLCGEAAGTDPDRLFRRARELRDELDEAGVADRERERFQRRSFRFTRIPDGMSRVVWMLDTESAATVATLYDRATSPRRGGPRFVDEMRAAQAESILEDDRTTEQLASDVFLDLLVHGADADSSQLLGSGAPTIRVLVTAHDLDGGTGIGYIEGENEPVGMATVERLACGGALVPMLFGTDGQPLDLGRERRLFSHKQKAALATRDGGCMALGCDRPPSFTEAHHIRPWARDRGSTDVADGILLCRHHHLLLHDHGWEISRDTTGYWLVPPSGVDPTRTPILLRSKSAAWRRMQRQARERSCENENENEEGGVPVG